MAMKITTHDKVKKILVEARIREKEKEQKELEAETSAFEKWEQDKLELERINEEFGHDISESNKYGSLLFRIICVVGILFSIGFLVGMLPDSEFKEYVIGLIASAIVWLIFRLLRVVFFDYNRHNKKDSGRTGQAERGVTWRTALKSGQPPYWKRNTGSRWK